MNSRQQKLYDAIGRMAVAQLRVSVTESPTDEAIAELQAATDAVDKIHDEAHLTHAEFNEVMEAAERGADALLNMGAEPKPSIEQNARNYISRLSNA